ncbi:MAG: hypothetical protein KC766_03420, partial [Myxococcales bacterium]|nr:hypothetical protein [Myxococcales bacterium]
ASDRGQSARASERASAQLLAPFEGPSHQILEVLVAHGRPMSVRLLAVNLRVSDEAMRKTLEALVASGRLETLGDRFSLSG